MYVCIQIETIVAFLLHAEGGGRVYNLSTIANVVFKQARLGCLISHEDFLGIQIIFLLHDELEISQPLPVFLLYLLVDVSCIASLKATELPLSNPNREVSKSHQELRPMERIRKTALEVQHLTYHLFQTSRAQIRRGSDLRNGRNCICGLRGRAVSGVTRRSGVL